MSPGSVWAVLQSSSVPALRAQLKTAELCPLVALPNTEPHTERSCEEAACCSPMSLWSHKPWNKTSCWHFNIFFYAPSCAFCRPQASMQSIYSQSWHGSKSETPQRGTDQHPDRQLLISLLPISVIGLVWYSPGLWHSCSSRLVLLQEIWCVRQFAISVNSVAKDVTVGFGSQICYRLSEETVLHHLNMTIPSADACMVLAVRSGSYGVAVATEGSRRPH